MDVKVFSKTIPLILYWFFTQAWSAAAPPKLLPKTISGNFYSSPLAKAHSNIASESSLIPFSDGDPSLSEYPLYATKMTLDYVLFMICFMYGNLVPMSIF